MSIRRETKFAIIPLGTATSSPIELDSTELGGLILPPDWTAAQLMIQVSTDGAHFQDCMANVDGLLVATPGLIIPIDQVNSSVFALANLFPWIRLRSCGNSDLVSINQEAERVITVLLMGARVLPPRPASAPVPPVPLP